MHRTLPMEVHNVPFLLERLHRDCAPLQYLRELVRNSIDAILPIQRSNPTYKGQIYIDVDWRYAELYGGIQKLAIIDNGIGMTGDEMVTYINHLSSSRHQQSNTGNYGLGAKIAAIPDNPAAFSVTIGPVNVVQLVVPAEDAGIAVPPVAGTTVVAAWAMLIKGLNVGSTMLAIARTANNFFIYF
jgi:hypothetical protein